MDGAFGLTHAALPPQKLALGSLLRQVKQRLWLILLLAPLGGIAALAFSLTLPKLYTAAGSITVAGPNFGIPEAQGALRDSANDAVLVQVHTELEAITARQLLQEVADQLKLVRRPEFNPSLLPPTLFARLKSDFINEIKRHLGGAATVAATASPEEAMVGLVSRKLVAFNDNRSTVIGLSFTSTDPQLSAEFVNALILRYRAELAEQRSNADQGANQILLRQIEQINADIAGLEKQVTATRDKGQLVGLRAGSVGQQELEELATQAARASLERSQIEATWERAGALARQGAASELASVLSSPTISHLRDAESLAASQYAGLLTRFGPNYPAVQNAEANLAAVRRSLMQEGQRIVSSLGAQLQVARTHEADAQAQLNAARDAALKSAGVQARLDDLKQDIASRRALLQTLQERVQQTGSRPATVETPDVRVLSMAVAPGSPSSPKTMLAAVVGGLAGAVLGLVFAVALPAAEGPPDGRTVAAAHGVPAFELPLNPADRRRRSLPARVVADPVGAEAEALRVLRARVRVSGRAGGARVLAIIPAHSDAAGARIAGAFARVAATDGERVLLIEGNLQSPALPALFDMRGGLLAAVLTGATQWRDALRHDRATPLHLLLADEHKRAAHALLSSLQFQSLLAEAGEDYTLIVVNVPSSACVASALTLAHRADASILIFDSPPPGRKRRGNGDANVDKFTEDLLRASSGPVMALLMQDG